VSSSLGLRWWILSCSAPTTKQGFKDCFDIENQSLLSSKTVKTKKLIFFV
jgi:hypothetical protein